MYVITDAGAAWGCKAILDIDHGQGIPVGQMKAELAARTVELLNRHGLQDCDTEALAAAILDLEQRQGS